MGQTKTDPLPSAPVVGGFGVVFTRKVSAASSTPSDLEPVDTGVVYNPDYEYLGATFSNTPPTAEATAGATIVAMETAGISNGVSISYKPDGTNVIEGPLKAGIVNANQVVFTGMRVLLGDVNCMLSLEDDGKFYTQYGQNLDSDFHAVVARRRRYG
jgi:hypothetical protein